MNSSSTPTISVIVPVYKTEKYIHKCLDSIINQTFKNFELILVDDGSPDRSGAICDEYAEKDERIKVIHKENEGVSIARNAGIELAKGEWIYFVDSDDWIDNDLLATFVKNISENIDLYFIGLQAETINSYITVSINDCIFVDKKEAIKHIYNKRLLGVTWNKLFNSKKIKEYNIRFNINLNSYEDELFTLDYCKNINCIKTINYSGYHYRYVNSGLSKRFLLPEERFTTALLLYKAMINLSKEKDFINYSKKRLAYHLYDSFEQYYYKTKQDIKTKKIHKKKYLLICYNLLHKNEFCTGIASNKRIVILKIIFLIKNWFIIDALFRLDALRVRLKSGKRI